MTVQRATVEALIGSWRLLRCEAPLEIQPGTLMQFGAGGAIEYVVPTGDGVLRIALRWRLHEGTLHTMHEDGSNPVAVAVTLGEAEVLAFDFGGPRAFFVRSS